MWRKVFKIEFNKKEDIDTAIGEMLTDTATPEAFEGIIEEGDSFEWRFLALNDSAPFETNDDGLGRSRYVKEAGINLYEDVFYFVKQAVSFGFQEELALVVENIGRIQRKMKSVWVDTEMLFGSEYAATLALLDKTYVPRYTWFVKNLYPDHLDHEILQCEATEALLDKHGFCDETVAHLVEIAGRTQQGNETLMIRVESRDFVEYLKQKGKLSWFKGRLKESKLDTEDRESILEKVEAGPSSE